jgi:hypothetical protein
LAVSRSHAGRVRVVGIGILAVLAATFAPPSGASAAKPQVIVSDFGVVASVKLTKPLARAAARSPVGAGLGVGIGHRDLSISGLVLRGSPTVSARVRGRLGGAIAITAGRMAWFFAEDPKGASIERVAVGGFGLSGRTAGARASYFWSGQALLDEIFSNEGFLAGGPRVLSPVVLKVVSPPPRTEAKACAELERQIRLAEEALPDSPKQYDTSLRNWAAKAGAHLKRQCGPAARTGGRDGEATGPPESGAPKGGSPGPPGNQAPTVTAQQSNGFVGKAGVEIPFPAKAADADGQVASWYWDWDDGTSTSGTGPDPTSAHTFGKAHIYQVRLTVTDDEGASTTETIQVPVGAPGSSSTAGQKQNNVICPNFNNSPAQFTLNVRIPSYAEDPVAEVRPDFMAAPGTQLCPGTIQEVSSPRLQGNSAAIKDEWGNYWDTVEITATIYWRSGAGGTIITPWATVTWK